MSEGAKEILTIPQLVRHIVEHWKAEQVKALKAEEDQREKLQAAALQEKDFTALLKKARLVAERMEDDFLKVEARIEVEKKAMIEAASIRKEDVLSGRTSMDEFIKRGKTDQMIYEEAVKETMEELQSGLTAARAKRLEILELEKELLEVQVSIRFMIIEPGRVLQRSLKDLATFAEREIGLFIEEVQSSKSELEQVKSKLLLTEGKSLGPGYSWTRLSLKEAYALQFSPILPLECIAALKSKLELFKDAETVNVTFFLRTKSVDVTSFQRRK